MKDQLKSEACSKYLRALGDPERLKIIQCLQEGPLTVGDITNRLGSPIANVSHHLKQLRTAGLITGKKKGRFVHYSLALRVLGKGARVPLNVLDFGCCRLELGQR